MTTDVWSEAGIEIEDIGLPFLEVNSRWKNLTVLALRKPEEPTKTVNGNTFNVYAQLDVLEIDSGAECTWDISSKRLLSDLRAKVKMVPTDIRVKCVGTPPRRVYHVEHVDVGPEAKKDLIPGRLVNA